MSNYTELLQEHHNTLYHALKDVLSKHPNQAVKIPETPCLNPDGLSDNDRVVVEAIAVAPAGIFYALGDASFPREHYTEELAQASGITHDLTPALYGFEYADPALGGQAYLLDAPMLKQEMEQQAKNESDYGAASPYTNFNNDIYMFYANVLDALRK